MSAEERKRAIREWAETRAHDVLASGQYAEVADMLEAMIRESRMDIVASLRVWANEPESIFPSQSFGASAEEIADAIEAFER